MLLITDIDPSSPISPQPATSWVFHQRHARWNSAIVSCFPSEPPLYETDVEGKKLSAEFPFVLWRRETTGSQIDLAARLLDEGAALPRRTVFVSGSGTGMRGHFDRSWEGRAGNLHLTIAQTIPLDCARVRSALAVLPVLALADTAQSLAGGEGRVAVKWINDILLDGAKIGGALCRSRIADGRIVQAIFGLGLNTAASPSVEPTPFVPRTGSLQTQTAGRSPLELLTALLSAFLSNHVLLEREGYRALAERYRRVCSVIGRAVHLYEDGPGLDDRNLRGRRLITKGIVETIDDDFQLIIRGRKYGSGRLVFDEDL